MLRDITPLSGRILTETMPDIDLHCHSICSDGELTPAVLVERAHTRGVRVLALTDHDSIAGLPEAQEAAERCGITLLSGVELSVVWRRWTIHVVGLGFNPADPALKAALALQAEARGRRALQIAERFDALNLTGSYDAALALAGNPNTMSRTHFAQWLVATNRVSGMQQAFDRYLGPGKRADVPIPWMPLEEGVAILRAAGGMAVLAHPGRYDMTRTKLRELLGVFRVAGGEGMEVATATEKPDMVRYLAQLSVQFGLLASQGSDFHGAHMPWIDLGRFPELPAGCRPVWQRWEAQEAIS